MKMRPFAAVWMAGLMIGAGGGLIVARNLPDASADSNPQATPQAVSQPSSAEYSRLFDPQQLPALPLDLPVTSPGLELKKTSSPDEPRLFPDGEASPVTQHTPGVGSPVTKTDPLIPAGNLSGFRQELLGLAPELNEEALNELERIRTAIESEDATLKLPAANTSAVPEGEPIPTAPAVKSAKPESPK